jgi:predicted transcriptional regulator
MRSLFRRKRPASDLEPFFGTLEIRVLEMLWSRAEPQSVRDLHRDLTGVAYTTVMTTLDRLHRKGVLDRDKTGRAFVYRPRYTRDALRSGLAGDALEAVFGARASELKPILSFFVETVSRDDQDSLAALERLVEERRKAARETGR